MKQYELMLIVNPELAQPERDSLLSEIVAELNDLGIKKVGENIWGEKELAYKIRASKKGYYVLYTLETDGNFFEFVKFLNIKKEHIWRHVIVAQ